MVTERYEDVMRELEEVGTHGAKHESEREGR